jgi:hypothetical protein
VAEVDTVEVTAAARNVADTEAVVVDAIANTDRTAVARATVVAVSPDTVAVASLDTVVVVVAAALTVVAMAHKLPEATEAARNRRLHQLRQSQLSLPLLRPCSHLSNSR